MSIVKEFYQFILKQDDEKVFDNDSMGWSGCAVGEFMAEKLSMTLSEYKDNYFDTNSLTYYDDDFLTALEDENPNLHYKLNKSYYNTYGQLKTYLTDNNISV